MSTRARMCMMSYTRPLVSCYRHRTVQSRVKSIHHHRLSYKRPYRPQADTSTRSRARKWTSTRPQKIHFRHRSSADERAQNPRASRRRIQVYTRPQRPRMGMEERHTVCRHIPSQCDSQTSIRPRQLDYRRRTAPMVLFSCRHMFLRRAHRSPGRTHTPGSNTGCIRPPKQGCRHRTACASPLAPHQIHSGRQRQH
jgi:hypothetical protein